MNFKKFDYAPIQEEVRKVLDSSGTSNTKTLADNTIDLYANFVKSKVWKKVKIGGLVALLTIFAEIAAKNNGAHEVETFFYWVSNGASAYTGWYLGDILHINYGTGKKKLYEQVVLPNCREYVKSKLTGK